MSSNSKKRKAAAGAAQSANGVQAAGGATKSTKKVIDLVSDDEGPPSKKPALDPNNHHSRKGTSIFRDRPAPKNWKSAQAKMSAKAKESAVLEETGDIKEAAVIKESGDVKEAVGPKNFSKKCRDPNNTSSIFSGGLASKKSTQAKESAVVEKPAVVAESGVVVEAAVVKKSGDVKEAAVVEESVDVMGSTEEKEARVKKEAQVIDAVATNQATEFKEAETEVQAAQVVDAVATNQATGVKKAVGVAKVGESATTQQIRPTQFKGKRTCSDCGRTGHEASTCFKTHPELRQEFPARRSAKRTARKPAATKHREAAEGKQAATGIGAARARFHASYANVAEGKWAPDFSHTKVGTHWYYDKELDYWVEGFIIPPPRKSRPDSPPPRPATPPPTSPTVVRYDENGAPILLKRTPFFNGHYPTTKPDFAAIKKELKRFVESISAVEFPDNFEEDSYEGLYDIEEISDPFVFLSGKSLPRCEAYRQALVGMNIGGLTIYKVLLDESGYMLFFTVPERFSIEHLHEEYSQAKVACTVHAHKHLQNMEFKGYSLRHAKLFLGWIPKPPKPSRPRNYPANRSREQIIQSTRRGGYVPKQWRHLLEE